MGWVRPDYADHEGYVVGLVDVVTRGWEQWRELRYPDDREPRTEGIERLQVACACGWRSRVYHAAVGPRRPLWHPYSLTTDEATEEGALLLWQEHMNQEAARGPAQTLREVLLRHQVGEPR